MNIREQLTSISDYLIIHASTLTDIGLYRGKMGIVLFFCQYARYLQNPLYEDFASLLLEEIQEEMHVLLPITFDDGLCGIGWGIEYLIQHDFMEADSDEILSVVDEKIMERDIRRISDSSLATGLAGIIEYVSVRLATPKREKNQPQPFDSLFLRDLEEAVHKIRNQYGNGEYETQTYNRYGEYIKGNFTNRLLPTIPASLYQNADSFPSKHKEICLGLEKGLAGTALKLIQNETHLYI